MKFNFLTLTQLRQFEQVAKKSGLDLMDLAANSVVTYINSLEFSKTKTILIVAGSGNNGGDGVSVAIKLKESGYKVIVLQAYANPSINTKNLIEHFKKLHGKVIFKFPANLSNCELIVDAVVGIGIAKELDAKTKELFTKINKINKFILALDTPSGLNPFTGMVYDGCIKANATLTFISDKVGLYTGEAVDFVGQVYVERLVETLKLKDEVTQPNYVFNTIDNIQYQRLIRRKSNTNKGTFGLIGIIGGGTSMYGSLFLAGRAAMLVGGGKVVLGFNSDIHPDVDFMMPELMVGSANKILKNLDNYSVLVVGPGLGTDAKALKLLTKVIDLKPKCKLIFDADALNLLAKHQDLQIKFKQLEDKAITPHPLEASRILGIDIKDIQDNRFLTICLLQSKFNCNVLLKGAGSLIANADTVTINTNGGCALSNAGQGDALCGIIASFIGQGLDSFNAIKFAVYLQGLSSDVLVGELGGYNGITATEIITKARVLLNRRLYMDVIS